MEVTERKERLQLQFYCGRSLPELIFDNDLVFVRRQKDALGKDNLAYLVDDLRNRIRIKIHDVLVATRIINITIAVYAKVELFSADEQGLVYGRQQQIFASAEAVNRHSQQAVITARVARSYCGVADCSRLVRRDNLPAKRVFQIHQLVLVEFQKCHICTLYLISQSY